MNALKGPLALLGRVLLAVFFILAGFGKIAGFAGTVGYATAMGLPLPQVGVAIALVVRGGRPGPSWSGAAPAAASPSGTFFRRGARSGGRPA